MSFEMRDDASSFASPPFGQDDGNTPLALAAGLVAGLVAGGLWALLVRVTNYEIGYAAWGVGLLVGFAMTRVTQQRTAQLAYAAAAFAVVGLLAGKAFIFAGSAGAIAREIAQDDDVLASYVAWDMYDNRELDAAALSELDATRAAGDTLSDAVWESMRAQAAARLAGMTAERKQEMSRGLADAAIHQVGLVDGIRGQLSLFDLLWVFLAVGTAYRMMAPAKRAEPAEMQPA